MAIKTLKIVAGLVLLVAGLAMGAYGLSAFWGNTLSGGNGKMLLYVGVFLVLMGGGLIGNAMGRIKW